MSHCDDGTLQCDMDNDCTAEISHLDEKGYIYCTDHGVARREWKRCRKLRPWELRKIQRGETLNRY